MSVIDSGADGAAGIAAPGYGARNAINSGAIRAGIVERSEARRDPEEVRTWLLNHFFRYLVGNFEPVRMIGSLAEAAEALGPEPVPEWLRRRFSASGDETAGGGEGEGTGEDGHGTRPGGVAGAPVRAGAAPAQVPVVWIDPASPELRALEGRLVEFLGSRAGTRLEGKLQRITCPQALALREREHTAMQEKIARGWRQSQPEATRTLLETENGRFVELLAGTSSLRAEMAFESYVMRHCLGQFQNRKTLTGGYGEHYSKSVEAGDMRVFSFRDPNGQPHITISAFVRKKGLLEIEQVKGKQNRPPIDRYLGDVVACLNRLHTTETTPLDCIGIGVVRTAKGWCRLEDMEDAREQTAVVAHHPQLFPRLPEPTAMAEWLVVARRPEVFESTPPRSPALRYAMARGAVAGAPAGGAAPADTPAPGSAGSAATGNAAATNPPVFATEGVLWPGCDAALARDASTWTNPLATAPDPAAGS
jgi:hypothetical protein